MAYKKPVLKVKKIKIDIFGTDFRPEWLNLEPLSVRRERVRLQESIQREFLTKFEPPRSPSTPNHLEPSDLLEQYSDSRYDPAVYLTF